MSRESKLAIAQGIGAGLQNLAQGYVQGRERQAAQKQQEILLNRLANASPLEKAQIYSQIDPKLGLEYEKQFQKQQQQSQLQNLLQQISARSQGGTGIGPETIAPEIPGIAPIRTQPQPTQTPSEIAARNQPAQQIQEELNIRPEDVLATSALNPAVSRALGDVLKGQQREKQFQRAEEREIRKETQKYADQVLDSYKGTKTTEALLSQMDVLASKGELTSPLMSTLLSKAGIPLGVLNNPDSEEFDKLANNLTRDIQKFYGARILASEFNNFLRQIPTLNNSPEGRKKIIENMQKLLLPAKFEYDTYKQIVKENGGKRPENIKEQVVERLDPLLEKWSNEFKQASTPQEEKFVVITPEGKRRFVPKNMLQQVIAEGGHLE